MADRSYDDIVNTDIMNLLGLDKLPAAEAEKLRAVMEETIKNRIIARVLDTLSEEEITAWDAIPAEESDKKLAFLEEHGISLPQLGLEEALIYKYELTQLVDTMRAQAQPAAVAS